MTAVANPSDHTLEQPLSLALSGLADSMIASIDKVIRAQMKHHASASALSAAVKTALPEVLVQGFKAGLLKDAAESHARRVALLQLLASAEARGLGAANPDALPAAIAASDPEELTSEQASKLLGVSRTHLNTLIDTQALSASRTTGGHRRVTREAVLAYKLQMKVRQTKGLDAMMEASKGLGLYDGELDDIPRRAKR